MGRMGGPTAMQELLSMCRPLSSPLGQPAASRLRSRMCCSIGFAGTDRVEVRVRARYLIADRRLIDGGRSGAT